MSYERKPNTGSIFKNKRKEKDTHPDSTGEALIDGKFYWINAWWNDEPGKEAHFSMIFNPKDQQDERPEPPPASSNPFGGG